MATDPWTLTLVALTEAGAGPEVSTQICPLSTAEVYDPNDPRVVWPELMVPDPPELVTLVASDATMRATWTAPRFTGGSPILYYEVQASSAAEIRLVETDDLTVVIGPVVNGDAYTVVVRAINEIGSSLDSNALTVTPMVGLPPVGDPPQPPEPPPTRVRPQPIFWAFPPEHLFRPSNWLLTPEQAEEAESSD